MNLQLGNNTVTWNIVIVIGMLLLVGLSAAEIFIPKPGTVMAERRYQREKQELVASIAETDAKLKAHTVEVEQLTYTGIPDAITPIILEEINKVAKTKYVNVKSFRPQKSEAGDGIVRIPYVLLVEGRFVDIVSFVRTADEPSTLYSVNLLQTASADGESDRVNATIGIVAFTRPPEDEKATQTVRKN